MNNRSNIVRNSHPWRNEKSFNLSYSTGDKRTQSILKSSILYHLKIIIYVHNVNYNMNIKKGMKKSSRPIKQRPGATEGFQADQQLPGATEGFQADQTASRGYGGLPGRSNSVQGLRRASRPIKQRPGATMIGGLLRERLFDIVFFSINCVVINK